MMRQTWSFVQTIRSFPTTRICDWPHTGAWDVVGLLVSGRFPLGIELAPFHMDDLALPGSDYAHRVVSLAVRLVVEDGLPRRHTASVRKGQHARHIRAEAV